MKLFGDAEKLWLMKGQLELEMGLKSETEKTYAVAVKKCPSCIPLWCQFADLELKDGNTIRARSLIEKARLRNPQNPVLWLKAIRIEWNSGTT